MQVRDTKLVLPAYNEFYYEQDYNIRAARLAAIYEFTAIEDAQYGALIKNLPATQRYENSVWS